MKYRIVVGGHWRPLNEVPRIVHIQELSNEVLVAAVPNWARQVVTRMEELRRLPADWDSYGARPISGRHRKAALEFLGRVMTDQTPLPDIVPLSDGGIQLEWRGRGVEVDFISDEEVSEPLLSVLRGNDTIEQPANTAWRFFREELIDQLRPIEAVRA